MGREVPGAGDHHLHAAAPGQIDQFAGLGRRDGHGLFDEHVQAALQSRLGLRVVLSGHGADDDGVKVLDRQHLVERGASVGRAEVPGDALSIGTLQCLHGHDLGRG